jgi:glycosyltransferase involved in cell wall biosynthesis
MGKTEKIILWLIFTVFVAVVDIHPAAGPEISVDDSRIYTGDHYINTIAVTWGGDPASKAPKYIKYEQPKGRSIIQISRKDFINYSSTGAPAKGRTVFEIELMAAAPSSSAKSKATLIYPEPAPGGPREKTLEINEPPIREKIFNLFKMSEFVLFSICLAAAGLGGYRITVFILRRKENLNKTMHEAVDRDLFELNSIGRLIDKKENFVFINQANSFIEKKIHDLGSSDSQEDTDKLSFVTDAELKRRINSVRQTLYNARFGGYVPSETEMEDIYQICKLFYELKDNKILDKK